MPDRWPSGKLAARSALLARRALLERGALLMVVVAVTRPLAAQPPAPSLSNARVGAQVVGGTLAAPLAFLGGGIASKKLAQRFGAREERASRAGYIGAYTATLLAAAAVPAAVGRDGEVGAALGGSALGMVASVALVRLGNWRYNADRRACGPLCWTMGAAVVALPSVGATVLYNRSRR